MDTLPSFDANRGQQVQGNLQSSVPNSLTFYLLSDQQYKIWASLRFCDPSEAGTSALLSVNKVTSYTLDWAVPADGTYWLVIETYSAGDCLVTTSIAKYYSQAVVSTIYSTQTSLLTLMATKTATSVSTQEIAAPMSIQGGNTLIFTALAVIIVVALAVAYFTFFKRKKKA